MPKVGSVRGINVIIFYEDHPPPHVHVRHGDHKAKLALESLEVLDGSLPPSQLKILRKWVINNIQDLEDNWERARKHQKLVTIKEA